MATISTPFHDISVSSEGDAFTAEMRHETLDPGIDLIHIRLVCQRADHPPTTTIGWTHPMKDIHALWHPGSGHNRGMQVDWGGGFRSKATSLAPVACLLSANGHNRMTFAFSDALNPVELKAGVNEESATLYCSLQLFTSDYSPMTTYEATLRIDTRDVDYSESLRSVGKWWADLPGYEPSSVPEIARLPMYSTWYSFHQNLDPIAVEEECLLAKELGCEAVIVDDGWQTSNNERGYAYCGDWEVCAEKIPDMKAHVKRVHDLGLKYILWYSVPFVGKHSRAWQRFSDKLLDVYEDLGAGVVDPRYPEVREYLIRTYEDAMTAWDLDGFKLDFVDSFGPWKNRIGAATEGRDYESVPQAVDRLLTDVIDRLRSIKPDVMVEFRQSYIGPLMRKYGNMFRAGDCPNDSLTNRVRTLDIRLLAGNTAAHSDMLMWHPEDPVESAALQIVNVLFSVPQISVMLNRIPADHLDMVRFWLSFWREHRDVLLDGRLLPARPDLLYPSVTASNAEKCLIAYYHDGVAEIEPAAPNQLILVNGTRGERIVLEASESLGAGRLQVLDCRGRAVVDARREFGRGIHALDVPIAGVAVFSR